MRGLTDDVIPGEDGARGWAEEAGTCALFKPRPHTLPLALPQHQLLQLIRQGTHTLEHTAETTHTHTRSMYTTNSIGCTLIK